MWKRSKEVTGVSAANVVGLKAVLFQEVQQSKRAKITGEKRKKAQKLTSTEKIWSKSNKGVNERNNRDLVQDEDESEHVSDATRIAALENKQKLYEKIVSGGFQDDNFHKQHNKNEGFLVDFEQKGWNNQSEQKNQNYYLETDPEKASIYSQDMSMEQERRMWEKEEEDVIIQEEAEETRRANQRDMIHKLEEQTYKGRMKHKDLKRKRKEAKQKKRQQIKEREKKRQKLVEEIQDPKIEEQESNEEKNEEEKTEVENDVDKFLSQFEL